MRRRQADPQDPPPELLEYDPARWEALVDTSRYSADNYRNRVPDGAVGATRYTLECYRRDHGRAAWMRAKWQWIAEHGHLAGQDMGEMLAAHGRFARRPGR